MGVLSNLLSRIDRRPAGGERPICRPAKPEEHHAALKLIFGTNDDIAVLDFLRTAVQRKLDLSNLFVGLHRNKVIWSIFPVLSPGRTALLMCPPAAPRHSPEVADELIDHACRACVEQGVRLVQVLLEPTDVATITRFGAHEFSLLADLLYLEGSVPRKLSGPVMPGGYTWELYTPQNHGQFASTIEQSYTGSMDCPILTGVRSMDDVLAGHRAAGKFDASWWFLLKENDVPAGVVLLNQAMHQTTQAELVYLGLIPQSRGRGLGDLAMRHAFAFASRQGIRTMTLAVDHANVPAVRLYHRHGMKKMGMKRAMMRQLAAGAVERSDYSTLDSIGGGRIVAEA